MMTLDLAIHHALYTADRLEQSCDRVDYLRGAEHRQLAAWLIELKQRREKDKNEREITNYIDQNEGK